MSQLDFDWEKVFTDLDGLTGSVPERDYEAMAKAIKEILLFLARRKNGADPSQLPAPHIIGRRVLVLIWVLDPGVFGGTSLSAIARQLRVTKTALSEISAAATRKWGIRNRGQAHGYKRDEYRDS